MPPAADQTPSPAPAPAYGLHDREPIRTPGGGLIMPDLPPEAHAKSAHQDRLNDSAAWAELVLQDWFKRLAVFGVSAQFDIDRFERATQALWRLTAVAKSVFAFDDTTNLPAPPDSLSSAGILPASSLGPRTAPSATPPPASNPGDNQENPSPLGPRTSPSADAPISNTEPPSPTTPTADSPSPSPRSALPTPHLSAPSLPSLSVRAVPACPTLSIVGIETYLTRTNADLAEATRPTPPILALPPTPPSSSVPTSQSSAPTPQSPIAMVPSPSPRSALRTPHFLPPVPPLPP